MFSRQSSKGVVLIAASVLWAAGSAAGAAVAQAPGGGSGGMQPSSTSQQQQMPNQAGAPGTPTAGMPETAAGNPQMYADQSFVHDTMEGDEAQVQMSQLAQQNSSSVDVKQFGQKMVQIHTELNNQLAPVAKQLGVSEPKGPSKKQKKELEQLQALSGPDFDTAYIQAMAKQQQHDLKEFKSEAQSGQSPSIQQAAKQDEPVLSEHYQVLQKLAQAHNVTLESKK
jgi:putative membrane protein